MAAVTINSGEITATLLARDVPKDRWPELVRKREWFSQVSLTHDCRMVVRFVHEANEMWEQLGYKSADDLIKRGYGLEPDEVRLVVEWLELNDPEEVIGLDAVKAKVASARSHPLAEHGGVRGQADNIRLPPYGTSQTYTLRRLARDRPDLLERVEIGSISANAAAIEAGFRKPTVQIVAGSDPIIAAARIHEKLGNEYAIKLKELL